MKKRILSLILCLCLVCGLLPTLAPPARAALAGYTASNYMQYMDKTTSYDIQGRDMENSDRAIMTTYANGGYKTYMRAGDSGSSPTFVSKGGVVNDVEMNYALDFSDGGRYVQVTYTLRNTSGEAKTVDFGFGADVKIDSNDRAPIEATDEGLKMYANPDDLTKDTPEGYVYDLIVKGQNDGGAGDPTTVWFGSYSGYVSNMFGASPTDTLEGTDSGISVGWSDISVPANDSVTVSYKMGVLQKANMSITTTDAPANGGEGSINVSVVGGSGSFSYGYLYNADTAPTGGLANVPVSGSGTAGQWQTQSSFSSGVKPGHYRVFYKDTNDENINAYQDVIIYDATKITYDTAGGTGIAAAYSRRGDTITLPTPTRDGYEFSSWTITHNGKQTTLGGAATYKIPETSDANGNKDKAQDTVALTANWVKSGTVSYVNLPGSSAPGGGYAMPDGHAVSSGTVLTLQNLTEPEHWTFDGWYKGDDRSTLLPGGAVAAVKDGDLTGTGSFGLTFYAVWTKDATISFAKGVDDAGDEVISSTAPIYVYPGSTISLPAAPAGNYTTDHSFAGWETGGELYPARGAYTVPSESGAEVEFTAQWVTSGTKITLSKDIEAETGKVGNSLTLTAEVKDITDAPVTGGSVTFYDGQNKIIGSGNIMTETDEGGVITKSFAILTVTPAKGAHSYYARYEGLTGVYTASQLSEAVSYTATERETPSITLAISGDGITGGDGVYSKTYDGRAFTVTPTVIWESGATAPASFNSAAHVKITYDGSATAPTGAGTYTVSASIAIGEDWYSAVSDDCTVTIAPKTLTPTVTCADKTYDGTADARLSVSFPEGSGIVGNDRVIGEASGFFDDTLGAVGNDKAFTVTGLYLSSGSAVNNYQLELTWGEGGTKAESGFTAQNGDITPAIVYFDASNTNQAYDGNPKQITVLGSSNPTADWSLGTGYNVVYYKSDDGVQKGDALGTDGTLGKQPVAAGTYIYEISCMNANYRLAGGKDYKSGSMTITSGGVSDFKFDASPGGAAFYANTMHVAYGGGQFTLPADSATLKAAKAEYAITYASSNENVVTVGERSGAVTIKGFGNAVITATLTSANYVTTAAQYAVQVDKAPLTLTVNDKNITYGDEKPSNFTYTVKTSELKNGDTAAVVTGMPDYSCAYAKGDNAGSYAIGLSGLSAANYDLSIVPGALTVGPKVITPAITASDKVYDGSSAAAFTVSFGEQLYGEDMVYAQASGQFKQPGVSATSGEVGIVDVENVSCTLVGATNYVLAEKNSWAITGARITPAIVTFVVAGTAHNYDGSAKDIVVTAVATPVKAWKRGEGYSVGYTPAPPVDKGGYDYAVTCLDPNYAVAYDEVTHKADMDITGALTITTNALTDFRFDQSLLQNNAVTKTYGDGKFTVTASSATAKNSGGAITYSVPQNNGVAEVNASSGEVTVTGAGSVAVTALIHHSNGNYADASASYVLTVNKKALTVTADSAAEVIYGNNFAPPAAAKCEGFVNDEDTGDLDGDLSYSTPYTPGDAVGSYAHTPGGYASKNYDITFVPGSFRVVKREVTPLLSAADKVYDGTDAAAVTVSWAAAGKDTGVFGGDVVEAVVQSPRFESADAADGKNVTVSGVSITLGSGNYRLPANYAKTAKAKITPAPVTYIVNGFSHTYDGKAKEVAVVPVSVPAMPDTGSRYSVTYAVADLGEGKNASASLNADNKPLTQGVYTVSVTTENGNYTGSASGTLEISANAQPVFGFEAPFVTAVYGESLTLSAASAASPVGSQTVTYESLNTEVADIDPASGAVTIKKAGTVTIKATSRVASYVDCAATCALIISKAQLTVTANGQSKVYGEQNPESGAAIVITGWKYEDGAGELNVDKTGLEYAYSCQQFSGVGNSYTVSPSGLASDCYDFKYLPGRVTVTPRPVYVAITAADKFYDAAKSAELSYLIGGVSGNSASGVVNNDIVEASAVGSFSQDKPGVDLEVSITNCQLITGGANYSVSGFTSSARADITATPVDFTALYVPSQYSKDIGLTVITVPSIARELYTVDYYGGSGLEESGKVGSTHGANASGTAPEFPGTYYFKVSANQGSGYSGSKTGSYTIENMTQTGHVANPVVTVNVGSTITNPVIHTNPALSGGKDGYGHAPAFTYQSSDPSVASISGDGVIRGLKLGTVTITVTSAFEGYFTVSWQYSVTVSSTMIRTKLTETVQTAGGGDLAPMTVIDYTPTGEGQQASVTLTRGTGGATAAEALTGDYSIFLRDSRAVGDNDTAYPYIQTAIDGAGKVTAGVREVGHYYIYIRMGESFAAAGYGDNKVQIGHFYVIPAAPTVGVAGGDEDVLVDYINESISWNDGLLAVGGVANAPLSTWADDDADSGQYHNNVSERPSSYASPAGLSVGGQPQSFAAWVLGGEANMSTLPGGVANFTIGARPAAPVSSHASDPIQVNVTSTHNSITVTRLINYTAPGSGVQYAAWPTADKAAFDGSAAGWFDSEITGLDSKTEYTLFIRVKAGNDPQSPCFASLPTEVTVCAPEDPGTEPGGSTPTQDGGAQTGAPPAPPASVATPAITETGTTQGDNAPGGGTGKVPGAQGELFISEDGKTVSIKPPYKYRVREVLIDGLSVGPVESYTFEEVTGASSLRVVYEWDNPFSDVSEDDWFFDAVMIMHIGDVIQGTSQNTFSPGLKSMRVALVTVLGRLCGIDESNYTGSAYADVAPGAWYAPFVQWATENEIAGGYGKDIFGVNDPLSREQVATLLYRYAKEYLKLDISLARPNLIESYLDSGLVSSWSYDAMRWCLETGILSGRGNGVLDPGGDCTRAELAQFLTNFQNYIHAR